MLALAGLQAQTVKPPYTTWSDYGGSPDSMQYSALTQITKANVSQLELAWTFPVPDRKGNFGFNPLVVDNVMYVLGPRNAIVALDAGTGKADLVARTRGRRPWQPRDQLLGEHATVATRG